MELFPQRREQILATDDRLKLWQSVKGDFYAALNRDDSNLAARCIRYAVWTLHPRPQAKTLDDLSASAAQLLYEHLDQLHLWIDRYDFIQAQKGLRLHLGEDVYNHFERRFLQKTRGYPPKTGVP